LSFDILSFDILSFDILSFDILSFDILSFDILSFDILGSNKKRRADNQVDFLPVMMNSITVSKLDFADIQSNVGQSRLRFGNFSLFFICPSVYFLKDKLMYKNMKNIRM
jgi:hypothetical protein